jgi:hypothetical protein
MTMALFVVHAKGSQIDTKSVQATPLAPIPTSTRASNMVNVTKTREAPGIRRALEDKSTQRLETGLRVEECELLGYSKSTAAIHNMHVRWKMEEHPTAAQRIPDLGSNYNAQKGRCGFQNCSKRAFYMLRSSQDARDRPPFFVCAKHKNESCIPARSRAQTCQYESCDKWPSYGHSENGKRVAVHCRAHAMEGEVNLKARLCKSEGCRVQATYGKAGSKPEYCRL